MEQGNAKPPALLISDDEIALSDDNVGSSKPRLRAQGPSHGMNPPNLENGMYLA